MSETKGQPGLHELPADAIVRPPLLLELADEDDNDDLYDVPAPARRWVRFVLVMIGLGWLAVFGVAAWLNPYRDGQPLLEATHRQLGLPACNFKMLTDMPCPSCGMTTSFALLIHGDLVNSLRANFVGTLLALIGLLYIPWALASMIRGRWLWVKNIEGWLIRIVFGWVGLMLVRWAALLAWMKFNG